MVDCLPIAKTIVGAHGGTIGVASRVEQVSVFTFRLPAEQ
jgi:signal transduction histidine kinase